VPVFKPNEPIITQKPFVEVENKFEPGQYVFRLVVRLGTVESQPVETVISVGESPGPVVPPPLQALPPDRPAPRRGRRKRQSSGRQRKKA